LFFNFPTKKVIVVGAHLDTVAAGPGINDNGSGSAAVLELALGMQSAFPNPVNKVRFCWWAAEEEGLLGSTDYVNQLVKNKEVDNVALYLNFDMIASQNYISFAFDGATAPDDVQNASQTLTNMFISEFAKIKKPYKLEPFAASLDLANTDYGPFLFAGIPSGGLHSGAAEMKSMAERSSFGGWANAMADSCYHKSCDTLGNLDLDILQQNGRLAASVLTNLVNQPDLSGFLRQPPAEFANVERHARLRVPEEDRQVCMSSHVAEELVCRKSTAKKARIPFR
jgi:Zn-dependent M28 family amino/carboxypeptidase